MSTLFALFVLTAIASEQGNEVAATYAEVAVQVGDAIQAGKSLSELDVLPELSEGELKELAKLAGCKRELIPGGTKNLVSYSWHCGASSGQSAPMSRSTKMRFDDDGRMFSFSVNPLAEEFVATSTALSMSDLPSRILTINAFAEAVRDGTDLTLGGLIPLTDLQRLQLSDVKNRNIAVYEEADPLLVVWQIGQDPGEGDLGAEVHFDNADRPLGVIIEESLIRVIDIPVEDGPIVQILSPGQDQHG